MSKIVVSELQHWGMRRLLDSKVDKYEMPLPVEIPTAFLAQLSFIEMLFNEEYAGTRYRYLYREAEITCWPSIIRERIKIYVQEGKVYKSDFDPPDCNINAFNLGADDFTMLDQLLAYRIDPDNFDTTALLSISYAGLSTPLAKLIYVFLEFKTTGIYSEYDNEELLSQQGDTSRDVLENIYEAYVVKVLFTTVSTQGTCDI